MPEDIIKIPPQSIEAEKALLGSLMMDRQGIIKVVDFLRPADFYKTSHGQIYQAMIDIFESQEPIDLLTISQRLEEKSQLEEIGGNSYLAEILETIPTPSHLLYYAKIVREKKVLRDLIQASDEISALGYNESEDVDLVLDEAEKKIFSISQQSLTQNFLPIKSELSEAFERIDRIHSKEDVLRGVTTGFPKLDNLLAGFQRGDLILLASRPSLGKSALSLDIARAIALKENLPVGIFSLEMAKEQLVDRLIAAEAGVSLWKLRTGKLSEEEDFTKIQESLASLSQAPIYIDDAASSSVLQMRALARRLQGEKGLGLIIVDYLQLIQARNPREGIVQQITEISRSLKALAKELNVPVLALSQLSRAVEQRPGDHRPKLADLRESGCLTGDSLIMRADTGERTAIKDLVGKTNIPVYSLNENEKIEEKKISKVFYSGKKMVYELKTRSGFKIKASANHPFRKIDGWHRLDQLTPGDYIATPKKLSPQSSNNNLSKEEIILLAHLLGDGCVIPHQPIHYTSGDQKNIKIVAKTAKKLFQINPRIVRQKNWWRIYLPSPYRLARGKHHPIINWYYNLGIEAVRSFEKKIPQKIFTLNEDSLSLFLKHLWATDGNISHKHLKKRSSSGNIYYSTTSPKMADDLKHLLLRFSIRSRISEVQKPGYRTCYHIAIQGKEDQLEFLNKIGSYGKRGEVIPELIENLKKIETNPNVDVLPKEIWGQISTVKNDYGLSWRDFAENYGMSYCGSALLKHGVSEMRLTKILNFMPSLELKKIAESDIFWDEIVSIAPLRVEDVYDATIPETHNFIANDIILHNSLEQDADVVLFIYRADKYQPEKAEPNITEVIVAKHRNGPVGKVELYFDQDSVSFKEVERGIEEEEII